MDAGRIARVLLVVLVCSVALAIAVPVGAQDTPSSGADAASPDGVYAVVGTTNTGKRVSTNVLVTSRGERMHFQARVMGVPISTSGEASWNPEHTEVTVPVSFYVLGLAQGSGSITLISAEDGWTFFGTGDGSVLGKRGSATAEGFMPRDTPPTPELVEEASGVSSPVRSLDDATQPLQPEDPPPALETGDAVNELAALLAAAFVLILLEMILGVVLL